MVLAFSFATPRSPDPLENHFDHAVFSIDVDDRPVDCVLAIDASGSFRRWLDSALQAAETIVSRKRSDDEFSIEQFISSDKIRFQDFTTDAHALAQSLRKFYIEGGHSAIIDGIYKAVERVADHKPGAERRKVVVVITDGEERDSSYKIDALLQLLHQRQVQVFAIGLTRELNKVAPAGGMSPQNKAEELLKRVAEESGGRAFFPHNEEELVLQVTPQVISALRTESRRTDAAKRGERKAP